MKRLLPVVVLAVLFALASCGSDAVIAAGGEGTPPPNAAVTTPTPVSPTATPVPDDDVVAAEVQRSLLTAARQRWRVNRPTSYSFRYTLQCECDPGPWQVFVDADGASTATRVFDEAGVAEAPYLSVDAIFDEIDATLNTGRFPVEVEYDPDLGVPRKYTLNRPELAVDGGFVLVVNEFTADPVMGRAADRQAFQAAVEQWQQAAIPSYDYTFQRVCFCPVEFTGPYEASVENGEVIAATLDGVDLFDLDTIGIDAYSERVFTVDEVFAEVDRAIDEAASYNVEYDRELGFPSNVFIDWAENIADEEDGYVLTELVAREASCSTAGVNIRLLAQPELPAAVAERRAAIFDAAIACDIDGLVALTTPQGFNASFGGGLASDLWTAAETRGEPVMLDLVRHLNLSFAASGEGADAMYTWPSTFEELDTSDGTGLSAADYAALLELYPVEDLTAMFDGLGGYIGYRIGIDAQGNWLFFVAGD